jgi:hypothetical protein
MLFDFRIPVFNGLSAGGRVIRTGRPAAENVLAVVRVLSMLKMSPAGQSAGPIGAVAAQLQHTNDTEWLRFTLHLI